MTTGRINQKTIPWGVAGGWFPDAPPRRGHREVPAGKVSSWWGSRAHPAAESAEAGHPSVTAALRFSATRLPFQIFLPHESAAEWASGQPSPAPTATCQDPEEPTHRPVTSKLGTVTAGSVTPTVFERNSSHRPSIHNTQLRRKDGASRA